MRPPRHSDIYDVYLEKLAIATRQQNTSKPIADFLGVSVHYLLTGEEAPARKLTTAEEDELLELYRALPQNKQFEFIGELKGISESLYRVSEIPRQRKKDYQFRMVPTLRPVLRRCAYE